MPWIRVGLAFLGAVLVAAVAVVLWAGDPIPPDLPPLSQRERPDRPRFPNYERAEGFLVHDYLDGGGADVGGTVSYRFHARRGAPVGDTYPLSVEYLVKSTGLLARVEFAVAPADTDMDDEAAWTSLGPATLVEDRGWTVAQVLRVPVHRRMKRLRAREVRKDGASYAIARTVPMAPSTLGRIRDEMAMWPVFRWLPDWR